jgi:hypothetical protein
MNLFFRFLVLTVLLGSSALFIGCGQTPVINDEVPPSEVGEEETGDNPPEDE